MTTMQYMHRHYLTQRSVKPCLSNRRMWSYPALDAVAEFRILSIQSLYSGHKQPFLQLLTTSRPIRQQHRFGG